MSGLTLDSIMNRPVDFSWDIAGFLIEGELPTATDISATNGIVHEVSTFLELPELPGPCDAPAQVAVDGAAISGTTAGLFSTQTSLCGGAGGEIAYEITSAAYQRVCVSVQATGQASDPLLYLREAFCDSPMSEIICLDDNQYPVDVGAELDVEMAAGETYFAFVDALLEAGNGSFTLSARSGPCAETPTETLYEILNSRPEYAKFSSLLEQTFYSTTLAMMPIHSVFIPTNTSLETLETETPSLWAALTSAQTIESFVGAHLALERHAVSRLRGTNALTMLNSQQFEVFDAGTGLTLGGVPIIESSSGGVPPVEATNGLVYGLDGALIPELPCGAGCPNGLVCGDQQLCTPPPPVGSCDNPEILVPFLTGRMSAFSADTSANISSTSGSCGQTDSPDHVFSLSITPNDCIGGDGSCPVCISTAPVTCVDESGNPTGEFLNGPCALWGGEPTEGAWPPVAGFNGIGTSFDTIIRVHEQSCVGNELVCEGQTYAGIGGSAVTVDMTPNQDYFVVVDALSGGDFGLFNLVSGLVHALEQSQA